MAPLYPDSQLFPTPQAVSSATFTPPPLDGTLTIPEIYEYHFQYNTEHPLFVYDVDAPPGSVVTINWGQAVHAMRRAAVIAQRAVHPLLSTLSNERPVIAILAVIDQLSFFALTAGIIRAGFIPFPISPRNSDLGVANLLQKTGAKFVFVSQDSAMQGLAAAALALPEVDSEDVPVLNIPQFNELYGEHKVDGVEALCAQALAPVTKQDIDDVVIILHSSGSTSFPKPIHISHRNLLQWGSQPYYGEMDICGRILSNHALPFFHAMGVVSLTWATTTGLTLSNFSPSQPPVVSTPDRVYTSATATKSNLIFCVPAFLEEWSLDPAKVTNLAKFDAVLFGGAPIQKAVGDELVSKGVKLYPFYGATEIGGTSKFLPKEPPEEGWEYFMLSPHTDPILWDQQDISNVVQLIFRRCSSHFPAVANTMISDAMAYNTNDLLIRHPTNLKLYKIFGRSDDQIMHSTGEKTNPVPMETIINRHPSVASCLVFGRGRFQTGLLVEPAPGEAFEPLDLDRLAAYRNLIWASIEEANNFAPSHSRIFKEMIIVTTPLKPFQYTPKGTPRRHVILDSYMEEINRLYDTIEGSSQTDIPIPDNFDEYTSLQFVKMVVERVLPVPNLDHEDDIFQHGCDSLKATWIRKIILNALLQSNKNTRHVPVNFVYANPSIGRLAKYVAEVSHPVDGETRSLDATAETISQMNKLVDKYSKLFQQHQPPCQIEDHTAPGDIVLLTGSTGSLGSYILEALVHDTTVARIYAFNRPGRQGSIERQRAAFEDRGIDCSILNSPKVVFIEGDPSRCMLGLSQARYVELRSNITCIMHNAWRVDFNVALSSMEPLILGTRQLIDLALSSPHKKPPRFLFTSSIGVVRNWEDGPAPEAPICNPSFAVGSGYPESKWVAERILTLAEEQTTLRPVVVRIGQMSGGRNGSWNPSEWVPSIVQSGKRLGCLPDAPGSISWIPVHRAAAALVEMRDSKSMFHHLCHPHPVPWSAVFQPISQHLGVQLVPYSNWLASLESQEQEQQYAQQFSALLLLDFFQSVKHPHPSEEAEAFGFPQLSMKVSLSVSPSLCASELSPLGQSDVQLWLRYWSSIV